MSRRLFPGRLADELAGEDRSRAQRLKRLARALVEVVREGLIRDGQVRIHGFGTFRLSPTRARKGINPRTGERIDIPARNRVLFRPAKALRERIEPGAAPAVPLAEPHASREASLGGAMSEAPAAGAMPATEENGRQRSYFPDRIAAAAISDTVVRTSEAPSPTVTRSGSREANLGGTMGDSPSAGRVPGVSRAATDEATAAAWSEPAVPAAGDEVPARGSREATLGSAAAVTEPGAGTLPPEDLPPDAQEPDRPATVPVTRRGPGPLQSAPAEAGIGLPRGASREASLSGEAVTPPAGGLPADEEGAGDAHTGFEAEVPLREDREHGTREQAGAGTSEGAVSAAAEAQPARPRIVLDEDVETGRVAGPEAAETRAARTRWPLLLLLLLLALVIAVLAWWFWPRAESPTITQAADRGAAEETVPPTPSGETAEAPITGETAPPAPVEDTAEAAGAEETVPPTPAEEAVDAAAVPPAPIEETAALTAAEDMLPPTPAEEAVEAAAMPEAAPPVPVEETAGLAARGEAAPAAEPEAAAPAASGTPWFAGRDYTVQRGDTLWDLSDSHYVNPYYWPHIWNHNPAIDNPDLIRIDQELLLPALQGEPRSLTAADRRSIAEGYLQLYRRWSETGGGNPQHALVGVRHFDPAVLPPELRDEVSAGRPNDKLAAVFEARLEAAFPRR